MPEADTAIVIEHFFAKCQPEGSGTVYMAVPNQNEEGGILRGFDTYEDAVIAGIAEVAGGRAFSFTIRKLYTKAGV